MSKAKKQVGEFLKSKWDASKNYSWSPEDEFIFSGAELGVFHQILLGYIQGNATDVQNILKITQLYTLIQSKIAQYVEQGIIVEKVD